MHTKKAKKYRLSISPLFILLGVILFFLGSGFLFIAYAITLVLHEMAHSEVARWHGYVLDDILLMPYGARLTGGIEGLKTQHEILIALAGPIFNIILAVICLALFWLIPAIYFFVSDFVLANIVTACYNLLPVFPLDGGRVFLSILSTKMPRARAVKICKRVGLCVSVLFLAGFGISCFFDVNLTLGTIGSFMLISTLTSYKDAGYKKIIDRSIRAQLLQKGLEVKEILVPCNISLRQLSLLLNGEKYIKITLVNDSFAPVAQLTESQFEDLICKHNLDKKVMFALKN